MDWLFTRTWGRFGQAFYGALRLIPDQWHESSL